MRWGFSERAGHFVDDLRGPKRLAQQLPEPIPQRAHDIRNLIVAGHAQNLDRRSAQHSHLRQIVAVEAGHDDVGNHQIERLMRSAGTPPRAVTIS